MSWRAFLWRKAVERPNRSDSLKASEAGNYETIHDFKLLLLCGSLSIGKLSMVEITLDLEDISENLCFGISSWTMLKSTVTPGTLVHPLEKLGIRSEESDRWSLPKSDCAFQHIQISAV